MVESAISKRWVVPEIDEDLCSQLASDAKCSGVLASLLLRRGVTTGDEAGSFLEPKLHDLSDPFELPNMEAAVARIDQAIRERERVMIFGDYDVDGVSSTCLLHDFFRQIDFPVQYRLPHRLNEGYGLKESTVREFAESEIELVITVDNGSSSKREIDLARELGIDVVVTDHHEPAADLPEPIALVNPLLDETGRAYRHFAGVGVTFKLVWALCQRLSKGKKLSQSFRDFLVDSLALVALGTVADVVSLSGENRSLVKYGLISLRESKRPGLRALVDSTMQRELEAGPLKRVQSSHVGFRFGPRINAAGRMGRAEQAVDLLLTDSDEKAAELFAALDRDNRQRKEIEKTILEAALEDIEEHVDLSVDRAIVIGGEGWHPGVIGIVASRLVERFNRPVFIAALGERCRGSVRSVPGVNVVACLAACAEHLIGYGGHEMAAGFEVARDGLPQLRRALLEVIDCPLEDMIPEIEADCPVTFDALKPELLTELDRLEPFGSGNPEPLLLADAVDVVGEPRRIGADGQHLSFFVKSQGRSFRAIAFGKGDFHEQLQGERRPRVSLLFQPTWNSWRGKRDIELNVRELRLA